MRYCQFCKEPLFYIFADLGATAVANSFTKSLGKEEIYPLTAYVCHNCLLVQAETYELTEKMFLEYPYFSSVSNDWINQCSSYCDMIIKYAGLNTESFIVEIGSNDGYLLKNFLNEGMRILGIEPAKNIAVAAVKNGIPTINDFFCNDIAKKIIDEYGKADLIIGNNVLGHVSDINDIMRGIKLLLKENAIITFEFPSLYNLIHGNQFDTIYHEHHYYLSLISLSKILSQNSLRIFRVDELITHGGSLRVYICHENDLRPTECSVERLYQKEVQADMDKLSRYLMFNEQAKKTKRDALKYLIQVKEDGKKIAAFGAAAKGSVFLNYCGIGKDFIDYIVDETVYKQGMYMPGVQIPIVSIQHMINDKPDCVVILPWNWTDEILSKLSFLKEYGGYAVTFIPQVKEYNLKGQ